MSVFYANPGELMAKGKQMQDNGLAFLDNVKVIYKTIEDLVHSSYTSPEAIALANEIEKHHDSMNRMAQIIADYGHFLSDFGTSVVENQQRNIEDINID